MSLLSPLNVLETPNSCRSALFDRHLGGRSRRAKVRTILRIRRGFLDSQWFSPTFFSPKLSLTRGFFFRTKVTAWTSFVASTAQATANFILSELVVFDTYFPGGVDYTNVQFRAVCLSPSFQILKSLFPPFFQVAWIVSEVLLLFAVLSNILPRTLALILPPLTITHETIDFPIAKQFTWIFRISLLVMVLDYLLLMIWLPIGVSRSYGFQSGTWVFTEMFNGTGAVSFHSESHSATE